MNFNMVKNIQTIKETIGKKRNKQKQ